MVCQAGQVNHLLTANFHALVRPVLAVWLPITVPPLRDTLTITAYKVWLCASLFNWKRREIRREHEGEASCLSIKCFSFKKETNNWMGRRERKKSYKHKEWTWKLNQSFYLRRKRSNSQFVSSCWSSKVQPLHWECIETLFWLADIQYSTKVGHGKDWENI